MLLIPHPSLTPRNTIDCHSPNHESIQYASRPWSSVPVFPNYNDNYYQVLGNVYRYKDFGGSRRHAQCSDPKIHVLVSKMNAIPEMFRCLRWSCSCMDPPFGELEGFCWVAIWRLRWCGRCHVSERTESRKLVTHALSWSWTGMSKHSGNGRDMPKLGPTIVFMGRHVVFNQVKWNAALSGLERYEMLLSQGSTELKWSVLTKKIMCINVIYIYIIIVIAMQTERPPPPHRPHHNQPHEH